MKCPPKVLCLTFGGHFIGPTASMACLSVSGAPDTAISFLISRRLVCVSNQYGSCTATCSQFTKYSLMCQMKK